MVNGKRCYCIISSFNYYINWVIFFLILIFYIKRGCHEKKYYKLFSSRLGIDWKQLCDTEYFFHS